MEINSRQILYFLEVAKYLNFTKAAASLYVAQPALSQSIAELEAQLGLKLFERSSRSVALTPAGQILLEACPELMGNFTRVLEQMRASAAGLRGRLRIGYLDSFITRIPRIMSALRELYPDVALEPVCGTPNQLRGSVRSGSLDAALVILPGDEPQDGEIASRLLLRDRLCLAAPRKHPFLESREPVDLVRSALVIPGDGAADGYGETVLNSLKEAGFLAPEVIQVESLRSVRVYLDAGMGFSVLPASAAACFGADTVFEPLEKAAVEMGLVWRADSRNPVLPLLLDLIEQYPELFETGEN